MTIKSEPYATILDMAELDQWLKKLESAKVFAIDTETTSLNAMQAKIVGISFAYAEPADKPENGQAWRNFAAYVPLTHDYDGAPTQLPYDEVIAKLKPILENPAIQKSVKTSNTTGTSSKMPVSTCKASLSTPCWNPTVSTVSPPATIWTIWR